MNRQAFEANIIVDVYEIKGIRSKFVFALIPIVTIDDGSAQTFSSQ